MTVQLRLRTSIPDEIDGQSVVFANAFERAERPGQLSVLLLHADRQVLLAVGDVFEIGSSRLRLAAIEPQGGSFAVLIDRVEPDLPRPLKLPEPAEFAIEPIHAGDLATLLKSLTPSILAQLGAPTVTASGWTTETRSTMHTEWNGGEIGPVVTTRQIAQLPIPDLEAEITVTDICYAPDSIDRQELAAYWRAGAQRAHIFLRAEGTGPMTELLSDPASAPVVNLITEVIRNHKQASV
jgi:hypothetical protein